MKSAMYMSFGYAIESFDLIDGVITRKDGKDVVIRCRGRGYKTVFHKSHQVLLHRLVYWLSYGEDPEAIDHIDGDKGNNSPDNLRACTKSQNNRNVGINSVNTSGFKGVSWNKRAGKWFAQIRFENKKFYLGLFDNPIDAAVAYDNAAKEKHGDFAKTNAMLGLI